VVVAVAAAAVTVVVAAAAVAGDVSAARVIRRVRLFQLWEGIMSIHRSSMSDVQLGALNTSDRRAAVQREEAERAAERTEQLASQSSQLNSPADRIRIWERLHALPLPRSSTHRLVRVIATQTELSVQQVQDEQRRRATPVEPSSQG
jgi:hypothetical protein